MLKEIFRKSAAFSLTVILTAGSFVALPAALYAQESDDKKKAEAKKQQDKAKEAAAADKTGSKGLSTSEDPNQIGKRKINSGTDKLFWLAWRITGKRDRSWPKTRP